jgi:hypothetical protein
VLATTPCHSKSGFGKSINMATSLSLYIYMYVFMRTIIERAWFRLCETPSKMGRYLKDAGRSTCQRPLKTDSRHVTYVRHGRPAGAGDGRRCAPRKAGTTATRRIASRLSSRVRELRIHAATLAVGCSDSRTRFVTCTTFLSSSLSHNEEAFPLMPRDEPARRFPLFSLSRMRSTRAVSQRQHLAVHARSCCVGLATILAPVRQQR